MAKLPIIAGFGGINAAGRSSGHHAYRRMVLASMPPTKCQQTHASLAALTGKIHKHAGAWRDAHGAAVNYPEYLAQLAPELERGTLIRRLEQNLFDPEQVLIHQKINLAATGGQPISFEIRKKHLPDPIPAGWSVVADSLHAQDTIKIQVAANFEVLLQCYQAANVNSAGQLPSGFDPALLYASRNHPRGLQLTVFAASDAINSLGIDWERVKQAVSADQISVYAGSGMGQLDYNGNGGMLQARLLGKKVSSKQLALGYAEMPADFINAYLLGNLGTTGTNVAACATFLYNLRQGIRDIQSGTHRVSIIGTSEAPLVPEIFEGFSTMGALADDAALRNLDGLGPHQLPDFRRACRPFGNNAGFTLAESAQCIVLFDDELALELGANIYGAINDVFINADGYKKSIASPGLGNYISVAKAVAATRNIIGDKALQQRTYAQAHGTGTPQNRQTESHILNEIATTFGIENWPVTAIKSYIGHSLASAAGDQLNASLGVWAEGIIPGILTVNAIADDVTHNKLDLLLKHKEVGANNIDAVILNSKGFGGNNATASILAPHVAKQMLIKRHGKARFTAYQHAQEAVQARADAYDQSMLEGKNSTIYKFDHNVLGSESIAITPQSIKVSGLQQTISLELDNPYQDMCD